MQRSLDRLAAQWRDEAEADRERGWPARAQVLEYCAAALASVFRDFTALDPGALSCLRVLVKISATADVGAVEWLLASDLPQSTFNRYRERLELVEFVANRNGEYSVTDKGREAATP